MIITIQEEDPLTKVNGITTLLHAKTHLKARNDIQVLDMKVHQDKIHAHRQEEITRKGHAQVIGRPSIIDIRWNTMKNEGRHRDIFLLRLTEKEECRLQGNILHQALCTKQVAIRQPGNIHTLKM